MIAQNCFGLVKDIERLNDLCTIARNLLATTKRAQNLAAEKGFDQQILKLIDVCVRVTARGFDGETNIRNEERWQKVVNLYKRLLITCLQFLHNFIMHNEHRKLVLWLDLFGNGQTADAQYATPPEAIDPISKITPIETLVERPPRVDPRTFYSQTAEDLLLDRIYGSSKAPQGIKEEAALILLDNIKEHMEKLLGRSLKEIQQLGKDPERVNEIRTALAKILTSKQESLEEKGETVPEPEPIYRKAIVSVDRTAGPGKPRSWNWTNLPDMDAQGRIAGLDDPLTSADTVMPRSAQSAAQILQEAKDELMARLQETSPMMTGSSDHHYTGTADENGHIIDDETRSLEPEGSEEEDDDDDDYRNLGNQERGLLTDIPLVLGPSEIEALPMIIQAGIVDSFGLKGGERTGQRNMQAVRCHILLEQESGRNLLRELLIFIAAWDLPDDEFYFKMMVQIMEAILKNGLMSHAYSEFGQAKDIISPAQAVVIKILTHIFRAKYSPATVTGSNASPPPAPRSPAPLTRVNVLTVRYIFTVFRGNIIPETCALIYLQGQIRAGHALAEDFPLNLWDMERVYEGVYQFLEFFAVLTESNEWKNLLVKWEIVYDLVTLIKELEASIPKAPLSASVPPPPNHHVDDAETEDQPVSVERPYEMNMDGETGDLHDSDASATAESDTSPLGTEDPSEFEWRNLKKLVVLVLSSLVWKSSEVQNQIRAHGGIEMILACTNFDAHNPYIKEHAVMCLKFLMEGNRENQELISSLEARRVKKDESGILERSGLEAVIDKTGKLEIKKKGETRDAGEVEEVESEAE